MAIHARDWSFSCILTATKLTNMFVRVFDLLFNLLKICKIMSNKFIITSATTCHSLVILTLSGTSVPGKIRDCAKMTS